MYDGTEYAVDGDDSAGDGSNVHQSVTGNATTTGADEACHLRCQSVLKLGHVLELETGLYIVLG